MFKRILAILLVFIFMIPQLSIFAEGIPSKEKSKEQNLVTEEYLVKYKSDKVLKRSPMRMSSEVQSTEIKEEIEETFKEQLSKVSDVEIKDELLEDSFGYKTQLVSIESSEDEEKILE